LLGGGAPALERKSHRLLAEAYKQIGDYVRDLVDSAADASAKAERLHLLHEVLKTDWTIIHMAATNQDDAYMLFQVLNDRGVSLTEGELLRSATLEAMEQAAGLGQISEVEELDEVLAEEPHIVRNAIGWLYASQIGQWPSRGTSLDDYMLAFSGRLARCAARCARRRRAGRAGTKARLGVPRHQGAHRRRLADVCGRVQFLAAQSAAPAHLSSPVH
jgi:hypothetical protein